MADGFAALTRFAEWTGAQRSARNVLRDALPENALCNKPALLKSIPENPVALVQQPADTRAMRKRQRVLGKL